MPFLLVNSTRVHYSDTALSESTRETLVLLHGLGSSQNYYHAIIPELAKNGYRCIAPDHTGAGRSSYTQVEQSRDSLSANVVGLMDALKIERAVVVGHSMSGFIAAHLAASHPTRFSSAVLIGSVYPSPDLAPIFEKRIATVQDSGIEAMANTVPEAATHPSTHPLVRAFIRELILGNTAEGYISNCRVIASAQPPRFGDIKQPVLIIAGDSDYAAPKAMSERIHKELGTPEGKKRLEVYEQCGHWIVVEKPDKVANDIIKFLSDIQ
ncbi:3-oxoadipate enol-lactone hydrolase [Pseudovirgaria hyperparasitica]|uniref:3-oxoadipate enol-lactone hydrolase n=1 Tax=Pseudovirgaria hyperparasitica TaxID=470096 RepID=A0A6A6WDD1_9PEZI|nr:3-oxoadipate enol-lactone hydrolase [Pseudovirgaria hyperparasitica]KAF2760064.1 3-oxoadipate enol-lactone hydrolase [Pseudovirgaria hyperparasitica]